MAGRLGVSSISLLEWRLAHTLRRQKIESSVFDFLDAEWILDMNYDGVEYAVSLTKVTSWNDFHPFEVTAWFEDEGETLGPLNYTTETVRSIFTCIWAMDESEIQKVTSEREGDVHFKLVCLFRTKKKKARDESNWASLETPAEFEGLSADLGNLLKEGRMPDVMLKCGNRTFPAHRAILASRSEVFSKYSFSAEPEMESFEVSGDPEVVEMLLKYVYCGRLPKVRSINELQALYRAAGDYLVLGLKKACSDCIRGRLTEENCISFWELAEDYSDEYLKDVVIYFVSRNVRVFYGETWLRFAARKPKSADEINENCLR